MRLSYIEAGEIVAPHGIRGELKILPWLDSPTDLCRFRRCMLEGKEYPILSCRVQKNCALIRLPGIETPEAARAICGKTLLLFREDAPEGQAFSAELIGMEAWCAGSFIGSVRDVLDYPGNQVYVIQGEHEYMVPAVKAFVRSISLEDNRMELLMIEGMRSDEN